MKPIYLFLCCVGLYLPSVAQPKVSLRLAFNAEQNQYEVFARPNFSATNFPWGPSQVSVVLPAGQSKYGLAVRSQNAGTWSDNSIVAPSPASANAVFHGISTGGGKLDMVSGEEQLLFTFTLPSGYVDKVRLFDNNNDPASNHPGMKGGDFRSYMSDAQGKDHLVSDLQPASLVVRADSSASLTLEQKEMQLVAYPNPAPSGTFRVFLKGFAPDEIVTLRLYTLTGVEHKRLTDKVSNLMGRAITIPSSEAAYWLLSLDQAGGTRKNLTQRIWQQN